MAQSAPPRCVSTGPGVVRLAGCVCACEREVCLGCVPWVACSCVAVLRVICVLELVVCRVRFARV